MREGRQGSTLLVVPAHAPIEPPDDLPEPVTILRRPSDFHWGRVRARVQFLLWGAVVARRARTYERLVVLHPGLELFVIGALVRRTHVTVVDFLMPRSTRLDRLGVLRGFRYLVLRRGDAATLERRFGIPAAEVEFVACPAPRVDPVMHDGDYAYSAGWAHRDWATLAAAQELAGIETRVAADVGNLPQLLSLGPLSPEDGRKVLQAARFVVLPFLDTELPSGPLVLLDAMAHGKPVVVSDVRGSRDYVTDGLDALVVPPGDPAALAAAMRRLDEDAKLRHRLGAAARRRAESLTPEGFWKACLS